MIETKQQQKNAWHSELTVQAVSQMNKHLSSLCGAHACLGLPPSWTPWYTRSLPGKKLLPMTENMKYFSPIKALQKYQVLISQKGNTTRQWYHADFLCIWWSITLIYIYMLLYVLYFLILILHCSHSSFYSNELYAVAVVVWTFQYLYCICYCFQGTELHRTNFFWKWVLAGWDLAGT